MFYTQIDIGLNTLQDFHYFSLRIVQITVVHVDGMMTIFMDIIVLM